MGRQTTTIGNSFGTGGNKDDSAEEKFFTDTDIQIDPEWKVIELLRAQLDDVTAAVNANDAASGSYADLKKAYTTDSGSFSTRATVNDAKTVLVVGSRSSEAKAGNTTTISTAQAAAIGKSATIINSTKGELNFGAPDRSGNIIITVKLERNTFRYLLEPL